MRKFLYLFLSACLVAGTASLSMGDSITIGGGPIAEYASYANVTAADNNVIKASAGRLQYIVVNSVTTSGTVVIYDNTVCAGTKIGTITAPFAGEVLTYGIRFLTGLCINTGSATDMDFTVSYH